MNLESTRRAIVFFFLGEDNESRGNTWTEVSKSFRLRNFLMVEVLIAPWQKYPGAGHREFRPSLVKTNMGGVG